MFGGDEELESPSHDDKNGIFQLSLCFQLHQSPLCLFLYSANMIKVIHIGFSELFLLTRLNIFTSACIDDSSFRCSSSAYLIRLAGFVVLRASFHQSHGAHCAIQLLLFPRHFLTDVSKNYFSNPFRTSPGARLSLPWYTTYFIR